MERFVKFYVILFCVQSNPVLGSMGNTFSRRNCQCSIDGLSGGVNTTRSGSMDSRTGKGPFEFRGCGAHKGFYMDGGLFNYDEVLGFQYQWCFTVGDCRHGRRLNTGNENEEESSSFSFFSSDNTGNEEEKVVRSPTWKKCNGDYECSDVKMHRRVNASSEPMNGLSIESDWSNCCARCNAAENCMSWSYYAGNLECGIYNESSGGSFESAVHYYSGAKQTTSFLNNGGHQDVAYKCEWRHDTNETGPGLKVCSEESIILRDNYLGLLGTAVLLCLSIGVFGSISRYSAKRVSRKTRTNVRSLRSLPVFVPDVKEVVFSNPDGREVIKHWTVVSDDFDIELKQNKVTMYDCTLCLDSPESCEAEIDVVPDKPRDGEADKPLNLAADKPLDLAADKPLDGESDRSRDGEADKPRDGQANKPLVGEANKPRDGQANKPLVGEANKPLVGEANKPLDGEVNKPLVGEANKSLVGEANKPLDGEANKPLDGEANKPLDGEAGSEYIHLVTQHKKLIEMIIEAKSKGEKVPLLLRKYKKYVIPEHIEQGPHYKRVIEDSYSVDAQDLAKRRARAGWQVERMGTKDVHQYISRYPYLFWDRVRPEEKPFYLIFFSIMRWVSELVFLIYHTKFIAQCLEGGSGFEKSRQFEEHGLLELYPYLPWKLCERPEIVIVKMLMFAFVAVGIIVADIYVTLRVRSGLVKADKIQEDKPQWLVTFEAEKRQSKQYSIARSVSAKYEVVPFYFCGVTCGVVSRNMVTAAGTILSMFISGLVLHHIMS